nr:hypothetical protein [uncultured Pseudomonas sp.]
MTRKYWKQICAIPTYMFLLSPSGNRVQKLDGGNWIDQHEAQKVIDAAEDELSGLIAENELLRKAAGELRRFARCQDLHHDQADQHEYFEPCKVLVRIDAAMSKEG